MMDQMNGAQAAAAPLDADQQAVVQCLEHLLGRAKQGEFVCIGVALVRGDKDYTTTGTLVSRYLMELQDCAEDLKDMAKQAKRQIAMQAAQEAQQRKPGIMRPPPGFNPLKGG